MEPDDSFFKRLNKLENLPKLFDNKVRFGTYNDKTLGFMVVIKHTVKYVIEAPPPGRDIL